MGKNKNGKQKARLEEVPELEEGEEYYDYSAEEDEDGYGLADMLGGEDNWAAGATAGQYDPWGGSKPQAASSSQWGATIPTPAQLAAQHAQLAAQHAAASGGKGGKKGNANNNNQKGDKKGGGKPAAAGAQAWQSWGMDTRPPAAADAWGNSAGGWDSGGGWAPDASDWGASTDEKRWETTQQSKHAQQGHWTGWGEEAKRLPKGHDVRSAYEQQKGGKHGGQQRDQKGGGQWDQPKGGGQWDQHKGGGQWDQPKGGGQWDQLKGGGQWDQPKGGGQWDQPKGGGQWDQPKGGGQWDQPKGGGQWDQPKGGGQWDQPKGGGQWDQPKGGGQWDQPKGGGQWDLHKGGGQWDQQMGGGQWDQQMGGGQWDQQKGGEQQKGGKKQQKKENKQKNKKNQQQQGQQKQRQTDPWATGGWDDGGGWGMPEEDEYDEHEEDRRVHFTPITSNLWGGSQHDSTYNMPSKTLAHAYKGTTTSLFTGVPRNKVSESANIQFIDSKGAALMPVHQALFGKTRMAKDRIHWLFSPNKDQRVFDLLFWIEQMAYHLGAYGLHRFLQSRERGALFVNADYLPPNGPNEPAFDWLSFDQLQATRDRVLQESVAFYDPGVTTIVFVFLPSKSGNSVAMWRRRITVSHDTRASRLNEIHLAMMGLRREKEYVVHVDEIPGAKVPDGKKAAAALADAKKSSSHKYDYRSYYPYETGHVQKPKTRKWWHIF